MWICPVTIENPGTHLPPQSFTFTATYTGPDGNTVVKGSDPIVRTGTEGGTSF